MPSTLTIDLGRYLLPNILPHHGEPEALVTYIKNCASVNTLQTPMALDFYVVIYRFGAGKLVGRFESFEDAEYCHNTWVAMLNIDPTMKIEDMDGKDDGVF
jgi:hypothetical protein